MSTDPIGNVVASAAGSPLAQAARAQGAAAQQLERIQQQQRAAQVRADRATGIAEPDAQDLPPQERDADGRQAWRRATQTAGAAAEEPTDNSTDPAKNRIDLVG